MEQWSGGRENRVGEGVEWEEVRHIGTQRARGGWWGKGLERERTRRARQALQEIPTLSQKESDTTGRALFAVVSFCCICIVVM